MKVQFIYPLVFLAMAACASNPKLDPKHIRPWSTNLGTEYPNKQSVIARYNKNNHGLFYLAARHTNTIGEDTLNLVETLFKDYQFDVLLIESIPYTSGESPKWYVEEAKRGKTAQFIQGGESAFAALLADTKKIPFFAGEPDHQDIYNRLKAKGYSDEDVIGFYTIRQIPQWVRQQEKKEGLLQRKIPSFVAYHCKIFSVTKCPTYDQILNWYQAKLGHKLTVNISNEETAPISDGLLFTQKISSEVGFIRDRFTLSIIEKLFHKYKRVAVIYGAGHFITLRKSFDQTFGEPTFIEDKKEDKK